MYVLGYIRNIEKRVLFRKFEFLMLHLVAIFVIRNREEISINQLFYDVFNYNYVHRNLKFGCLTAVRHPITGSILPVYYSTNISYVAFVLSVSSTGGRWSI